MTGGAGLLLKLQKCLGTIGMIAEKTKFKEL